jgi:hypothetical protein
MTHKKVSEIQISVSINRVLLEHSHTLTFVYCLWQPPQYSDRLE